MSSAQSLPIALFDSGVGGLSVAAHVMRLLPGRSILYFGDSARVPYGSKSEETVRSYTRQACHMLGQRGIALIGIAWWVSREEKGHEKDTNDYFLAGSSLPWWAIGASLIAANI